MSRTGKFFRFVLTAACMFLLQACSPDPVTETNSPLLLPSLGPVSLEGRLLRAVATTGIIGDVAAQVGGEAIELRVLMAAGVDPHSFIPTPQDLAAMEEADVVLVNGWNLEESLLDEMTAIGDQATLVPVSAGIEPLSLNGTEGMADFADPHVWFDVGNVIIWTSNIERTFSRLDPANAEVYARNGERYRQDLAELDRDIREQVEAIPPGDRVLVTNHDSLAYFAAAYGFEVIGTILPATTTLAEPSAAEIAALVNAMQSAGVCTIFTDSDAAETLARTVAAELDLCSRVALLPLYTGNLGPPGSGANSYVDMMRFNLDAILKGMP